MNGTTKKLWSDFIEPEQNGVEDLEEMGKRHLCDTCCGLFDEKDLHEKDMKLYCDKCNDARLLKDGIQCDYCGNCFDLEDMVIEEKKKGTYHYCEECDEKLKSNFGAEERDL